MSAPKAQVSLMEWLRSGVLGGIGPGHSKPEVEQALGAPFGWIGADQPDFRGSSIWGYGVWTLYFEDETLDAITCAIGQLATAEWYFDVVDAPEDFGARSIDDVATILAGVGLPIRRMDDRVLMLRNDDSGEIVQRRSRLSGPALFVGDRLQARIRFEKESGCMSVIGHPYCPAGQTLSWKCLQSRTRTRFSLV